MEANANPQSTFQEGSNNPESQPTYINDGYRVKVGIFIFIIFLLLLVIGFLTYFYISKKSYLSREPALPESNEVVNLPIETKKEPPL